MSTRWKLKRTIQGTSAPFGRVVPQPVLVFLGFRGRLHTMADIRTSPMNATNQETGPEDLVEDLGVRELDEDQCSSAGSESCWGETESIGDDEDVEWGTLPLPSIDQGAVAHPADTVDDFQVCLPSPPLAGWEPPGARVRHHE